MKKRTLLFLLSAGCFHYSWSQQLVKDINSKSTSSYPSVIGTSASGILLTGNDGVNGSEHWFSDGTASGTQMIEDICPGVYSSSFSSYYIQIGDTWYFVARHTSGFQWSLWKTDGTSQGTEMLKDLGSIPVPPGGMIEPILMAAHKNKLFLSYEDPAVLGQGKELWVSDGTPAGTKLVKDINPIQGSNPGGLVSFGDYIYFFANDGTSGNELWRSDGTESGTTLVKDIYPGTISSCTVKYPAIFVFKDKLYFGAQGTHDEGTELYRTDGTAQGTELFMDINTAVQASSYPAIVGTSAGFFLFSANNGNGAEPWVSDGTVNGTKLLKDIYPGTTGSTPGYGKTLGNKIIFNAADDSHGYEMWVTDGTVNGTKLLKDIEPGTGSSYPLFSAATIGNRLFFPATTTAEGTELWETDGTENGTRLHKDIAAGTASSDVNDITAYEDKLYFIAKVPTDTVGGEFYTMEPGQVSSLTRLGASDIRVYPNPVKAGTMLYVKEAQVSYDAKLKLISSDGKTVLDLDCENGTVQIPQNLEAGVYILQLQNSKANITLDMLSVY